MHALDERSTSVYLNNRRLLVETMCLSWVSAVPPWCLMGCLDEYTQMKPTTFAWSFKNSSSLLTLCLSIIQNCLSEMYYQLPVRQWDQERNGQFGILRRHTSPLCLTLSPWFFLGYVDPHGFTMLPGLLVFPTPSPPLFHSCLPLTLSPSALCVSPVSSFLKNGVSSGFTLAASRGIHGNKPVHGARQNVTWSITPLLL